MQFEQIRRVFAAVPVNRHLGFDLLAAGSGETVVSMKIRAELVQETGVLHGGIISALADTAAVYLFYPFPDDDRRMTCVEFKINFLAPARPGRGPVQARAVVVRRGSRIGVADVAVTQSETPVAKGTFTYLLWSRTDHTA
jgi:uncharacterized protein (TIGR00369 family)